MHSIDSVMPPLWVYYWYIIQRKALLLPVGQCFCYVSVAKGRSFFFFFLNSVKSWLDRTRIITSSTLAVLWSIREQLLQQHFSHAAACGWSTRLVCTCCIVLEPFDFCLHAQTLYTTRILRVEQSGAWDFKFLLQIWPITKVWHHHLFLS